MWALQVSVLELRLGGQLRWHLVVARLHPLFWHDGKSLYAIQSIQQQVSRIIKSWKYHGLRRYLPSAHSKRRLKRLQVKGWRRS
jgi:hypothetical protein